jgi:hypothetical protein
MKLTKMIRHGKILLFLGISLGTLSCSLCSEKITLEEFVTSELAKEGRHDSLIYGIRFGMTNEEFRIFCTDMNRRKLFMPNQSGSAVRLVLQEGFGAPVHFDFFPNFENSGKINKVKASLNYRDFSYYNKDYAIENLIIEAKNNFENGYGGNKFLEMPHDNKLLKYQYVKIDGNRKIVLSPNFNGQMLNIEFEDLNPSYK